MKQAPFFQSFTQQLIHWSQQFKEFRQGLPLSKKTEKSENLPKSVKMKSSIYAISKLYKSRKRTPFVFALAVLSFIGVMGHDLYNQPQLRVGTTAPQTIKAPVSANVEDKISTDQTREFASKSSIPILMVDPRVNGEIDRNLKQIINEGNKIRASVGSFPFFNTTILSISIQRYLRSCSYWEWQALQLAVENNAKHKSGSSLKPKNQRDVEILLHDVSTSSRPHVPESLSIEDAQSIDLFQKADFTQAVAQLEAYRLKTSEQNLLTLYTLILKARQGYSQVSAKLLQLITINPQIVYKDTSFLDLPDDNWAKTQMGIHYSAERILTQGISPGLPPNILKNAVELQVQGLVPRDAEPIATKMLMAVLKPNLKKDEIQTTLQAVQAAAGVKPVMVSLKQGEIIVRKGERITESNFEVLDYYHLTRREINWLGLMLLGGLVSGAVSIFAFMERRIKSRMRQSDRLLVMLLTLSTPLLLTMGINYTTWSAVGLLLGSFYGPVLGVTVMGLLFLLLSVSLEVSKVALLAGAAAGLLGSCMAQRLRSREELALLSVVIALTQGGVYLTIKVLSGAAFGSSLYVILQQAAFFALSGLAWSIVAFGLSPYLEKFFDLVTPIRLAELANPNRPLLKRLATETPGTFQHTLFVATLAEAAAKQLGCNVELVRAGTLYHDIGKMHDPLAFIENQMGEPNKHDTEIKDPWKSAAIIKKHVTQGLIMARKHRLPTAIQAFIPEHQGTMQIAYFYHQAQQMAQADPTLIIDESDFCYDGPAPQSRETAIVMLADSCEAALRSLKDVTPEKALATLNNILRARWQENQLVHSGLKREEMSQIAEIFLHVWQQFHHKRIAYPKFKAGN
ncbi:MAG: HDIG domain-containing protein [Rhizonema sp. PD38]|nr:HDIG domain-containing protein [Rhizonema sp. PD38]